jgi:hypothetical protein
MTEDVDLFEDALLTSVYDDLNLWIPGGRAD